VRFLPHTDDEIVEMLAEIGVDSLDDLFEPIPAALRLRRPLDIEPGIDEMTLTARLQAIADRNIISRSTVSFLGAGLYEHYVPHAVGQLLLRSEFLTAYTPYQPEISQGTLKTLFEYQSMMATLLGLDVANASMYDGAHGAAEAALMAMRLTRKSTALVSPLLHPEYRDVISTYLGHNATGVTLDTTADDGTTDLDGLERTLEATPDAACVVIQSPNFWGCIEPVQKIADLCKASKALLVVTFNEPLAFGVLEPPGELGADIAAGEAMTLGNSIGFGGPSLGVFAARKQYLRQMPGRLAGQTVDAEGREGYVLTLSTREQHIRRARATSNICTNQGLCATAAAIYLSLVGKQGLVELSRINLSKAEYAKAQLTGLPGVSLRYSAPTFNEFTLRLPLDAATLVEQCAKDGVLCGVPASRYFPERPDELLVAVTELHSREAIDRLVASVQGHI
jgi:glycine dehydrogenase subunit 1